MLAGSRSEYVVCLLTLLLLKHNNCCVLYFHSHFSVDLSVSSFKEPLFEIVEGGRTRRSQVSPN